MNTRLRQRLRGALPGDGMSLEARALIGVMGIVLIALFACAVFGARVLDTRLQEATADNAAAVGTRLGYLARHGLETGEHADVHRWVDESMRDPRVLFAVVSDPSDNPIVRQVRDARAWASHDSRIRLTPLDRRRLKTPEPLHHGETLKGFVYRVPVWTENAEGKRHLGYATVAYMDPMYAHLRAGLLRSTALISLLAALGSVPMVLLAANRLTKPLRRMANAASQLAAGERPTPLNERGPLEIAALARSFNRMASGLSDARESLVRANRELENAVRARTEELAHANRLLRAEIDEKSEFVRSISHDLSAPLRNIAGMTDLLLTEPGALQDDARAKIERIRANAHMEQKMLVELLELSRIGARPEKPEVVPVRAVVDEVAHAFEHELAQRGVQLKVHDPLPTLLVERARLRHVVQNLVDNAIKYMGDQPVRRIDISASVDAQGVRLVVADTGPGIPEHERESVFQVFRRASTSIGATAGVGVGLASVKAMVERWSGSVTLESESGRGSRFIVRAPLERVVRDEGQRTVAA